MNFTAKRLAYKGSFLASALLLVLFLFDYGLWDGAAFVPLVIVASIHLLWLLFLLRGSGPRVVLHGRDDEPQTVDFGKV